MKRNVLVIMLLIAPALGTVVLLSADEWEYQYHPVQSREALDTVQLPAPRLDGGRPLMQVLRDRQSQKSFSTRKLPLQVLSELLWAAYGINRPDIGKRTAPSSHNAQETDIYVALEQGLYRYVAQTQQLQLILDDDIRERTAIPADVDYVRAAPVTLIYVADSIKQPEETKYYAATGFIGQNVYLYCASEGLATTVRAGVPKEEVEALMGLPTHQTITLCQPVGYPAGQEPAAPGDVNGDGIIDATTVILDMDRNGLISIGDAFTHTYEDGMMVQGTIGQNHIDWLMSGGYTLDAAGLQAAANAIQNDPRQWSNVRLTSPTTAYFRPVPAA